MTNTGLRHNLKWPVELKMNSLGEEFMTSADNLINVTNEYLPL